jgi:hypothetical protein
MQLEIPPCPFAIGQHISFLELGEEVEPLRWGRGIIKGMEWAPGHWRIPGWVLIVAAYELPKSPWLDLPYDAEVPAGDASHCTEPIPDWAINQLRQGLVLENLPVPA